MAKRQFKCDGLDELISKLDKLTDAYPLLKASLYDGAGILADEIKRRCPTEELKKSVSIAKFDQGNGRVGTAVVFAGYDSTHKTKQFPNGVPNALIAATYESGTSIRSNGKGKNRGAIKKHPFIQPAIRACRERANNAMQKQLDEQISNIMEG